MTQYDPRHAFPTPPAPPAPAKNHRLLKRIGMTAAFFVTFLFGYSVGDQPDVASTSSYSAPAATTPAYDSLPTYEAPAPAVEQAPVVPAGTITNGTYEIGTEVEPGKYKSPGPESGLVSLCYVDVQRGDDFLAQEVSNDGQVRIEIKASWKGALMEVSGCQPLVKQ